MNWSFLDDRPVVVAVAGSNGAGKSTFFETHLRRAALPFVNADALAAELDLPAYDGAQLADAIRRGLLRRSESFIFETVFSDRTGEKLRFLGDAVAAGYTVVLCFIGISSAAVSQERVSMRVASGGHDVPDKKLTARFPRTLANLHTGMRTLPHVLVFDHDDLRRPYRLVAALESGVVVERAESVPGWIERLLP